ncbi:MAG: lipase family protein [Deltaproteobacteria bacterium]|nr:lipase family protein [Deltaproteobacteria bacterium]
MTETMSLDTSWNALLRPWISDRYFDVPYACPFETDAPDCSIINAWWLCEISRLIYRQGPDEAGPDALIPTRSEILDGAGLREIETFANGTNYCALVESRNRTSQPFAVLVFRGTSGFEGWLSNLKAVQTYWPGGGSVHSGFKADFLGLWQKIEPTLSKIDLPLYFTGHSLGGALAILAASVYPARAVYTFGAPKTGDSVFADSLKDARIYRFENDRDIITTVPPSAIPFDFCHVGVPICLKDDMRTGLESDSTRGLTDPPEFLSDHAPVNYTIRLETGLFQQSRSS